MLHGLPCSIVGDQDVVFTSNFWTELFQMAGVKLHLSFRISPTNKWSIGGHKQSDIDVPAPLSR
jgi:hypothetical protein